MLVFRVPGREVEVAGLSSLSREAAGLSSLSRCHRVSIFWLVSCCRRSHPGRVHASINSVGNNSSEEPMLIAKYDYLAREPGELNLTKNEKLLLLDDSRTWWKVCKWERAY